MSKLYFIGENEYCHDKNSVRDYMLEHDLPTKEGHEAKIDYGGGYFFCKELNEVGKSGDEGCGKDCSFYAPRNGKNGRCRFHMNCYTQGKKVLFEMKNDKLFIKEKP